jgi:hypothetical protein
MNIATQKATGATEAQPPTELVTDATSGQTASRVPGQPGAMRGRLAKNPRAEHRQAQRERSDEANRLAQKYPNLKSLTVQLKFGGRASVMSTTGMKYSLNLTHAKSVLVIACPSPECIGGDFDLTTKLATAVAELRTQVGGEMHCLGSHKHSAGASAPCRSLLHYTLNLAYSKKR